MGIALSKDKGKKRQASLHISQDTKRDAEGAEGERKRTKDTTLFPPSIRKKMSSNRSSGSTRAAQDAQGDVEMAETGRAGNMRKFRSSRRRTRSMVNAEQSYEEGEMAAAHDDSKRMRRRIKGKYKAIDEAGLLEGGADTRRKAKGKGKQGPEADTGEATTGPVPATEEASSSEEVPSRNPAEEISGHSLGETDRAEPVATPPIDEVAEDRAEPYNPLDPFGISSEERSRARSQITQALGVDSSAQLQANRLPPSDPYRPSMLSALLTDILGLRSTQMAAAAASSVNGGIGRTPPPLAPSPESRQRTGGTSVIVQGALISRTLPSRPTGTTDEVGSEPARAAQSTATEAAPSPATQPGIRSSGPTGNNHTTDADGVDQLGGEPQVATIEEQAAMLIRLLSIATAATAASLVSRPPRSQSSATRATEGRGENNETQSNPVGGRVPSAGDWTGTRNDLPRSDASQAAVRRMRSLSTSTSSSALSSSSSWRQASQTLQMLRERISAVRRRLQGLRLPRREETRQNSRPESHISVTDSVEGSSRQEEDESSPSPAAQTSPSVPGHGAGTGTGAARQRREMMTGSLDSLSNMLQDAIRQGVPAPNHYEGRSGSRNLGIANPSQAETTAGQRHNVHATLDAVRDGHLTRGGEGTFARFLFDLMGDLDVAVRSMSSSPTAAETESAAPVDEDTRLRRERDLHAGQLSFFRLFTFPNASAGREADATTEQRSTPASDELLPCLVVGVRSLEANQTAPGERLAEQTRPDGSNSSVLSSGDRAAAPANDGAAAASQRDSTGGGAMMSRFLLFVSGGHYPPQHPLFHSTMDEASRDLMILIEFLGAMTSLHPKPSTVTKEQIDKSSIQTITCGVDVIATMVKEKKVMENTSERCLICLEDWTNEDTARRLLDCAHLFHAPCIDQWLTGSNNSCPLCRRQAVVTSSSRSPLSEHGHPAHTTPSTGVDM